MTSRACRSCGRKLSARPPTPGRPPVHCSTGCRRAAEHELRRLNRRLERIEDELAECERAPRPDEWTLAGWTPRERAAALRPDVERMNARIRELLEDPSQADHP